MREAIKWRNLAAACLWTMREYARQERAAMMRVYRESPHPAALDAEHAAMMRGLMMGRAQAYKEIAEELNHGD